MQVIEVWPGPAPGDYGAIGEEMFRPPWSGDSGGVRWLTNVTKPTLTVYRPAKERDTGAAMLVCPGGGYWNLAWDLEGEEVAEWLTSIGVTAALLKYRVPRRPGQPERLPAPGPLRDAQRTVRIVRRHAGEWGIDPQRIGMVGFSAGGHLTLATATHFDVPSYEPIDAIDGESCRPDFAVMLYSGYLVPEGTDLLSPSIRIPDGTPPVFLAHAGDDGVAGVENSVHMYLALKRAGVPAELHVYGGGGHGWGIRRSDRPVSTWTERCVDWLRDLGVLKA